MSYIEKIAAIGIPTKSPVTAIQWMRDHGFLGLPSDETRFYIADITGKEAPSEDERELDYTFRYVVSLAISDPLQAASELVSVAYSKAKKFITENSYVFAVPEAEKNAPPKLDATGKPKPKKGAKKEMAKKVYAEKIKDKGLSRKEAIAILMEDVGMTSGGASTYYANLKAGRL